MTRHSVGTWEDDYYDGVAARHDDYVEGQIEEYGDVGWDVVNDESSYREFIEDTSDDEILRLMRGYGKCDERECGKDSETKDNKEADGKLLSETLY